MPKCFEVFLEQAHHMIKNVQLIPKVVRKVDDKSVPDKTQFYLQRWCVAELFRDILFLYIRVFRSKQK